VLKDGDMIMEDSDDEEGNGERQKRPVTKNLT
jgi:hypothetical protein